MATNPDIQNSFGPEVAAHEYMQHSAPQTNEPECPLYPVEDPKAQYQHPPSHPNPEREEKRPARRILGLSVPVFWTLVAIAVLVVLGTGIGVGLGVGLSEANKSASAETTPTPANAPEPSPEDADPEPPRESSTSPSSESPTSTTSAPVTSGTVGLAANSCNFTTPRTHTTNDGTHFTQFCFTDWPNGGSAHDGQGKVDDLRRLTKYTFEDCMDACISYNDDVGDDGTSCMAVAYNSNLTSIIAVGKQGGNCFLKNKRGEDHTGSAESACAAIAR